MRIVVVLIYGISMLFLVSIGWYASLPIILGIANSLSFGTGVTYSLSLGIRYASYAWGPALILFILLWMVISAQARDVESEMYG